jgi:hypothetical protein
MLVKAKHSAEGMEPIPSTIRYNEPTRQGFLLSEARDTGDVLPRNKETSIAVRVGLARFQMYPCNPPLPYRGAARQSQCLF